MPVQHQKSRCNYLPKLCRNAHHPVDDRAILQKQGQVSTQFAQLNNQNAQQKQTKQASKPINAYLYNTKNPEAITHRNYAEIRPRRRFSQPGHRATSEKKNICYPALGDLS